MRDPRLDLLLSPTHVIFFFFFVFHAGSGTHLSLFSSSSSFSSFLSFSHWFLGLVAIFFFFSIPFHWVSGLGFFFFFFFHVGFWVWLQFFSFFFSLDWKINESKRKLQAPNLYKGNPYTHRLQAPSDVCHLWQWRPRTKLQQTHWFRPPQIRSTIFLPCFVGLGARFLFSFFFFLSCGLWKFGRIPQV